MSGVNRVILIGRLGQAPEIKTMDNGTKLATFSLATSEKYKKKDATEYTETTEWHNIVIWGKLAEVVEKYVHKGDQIYIEGRLNTRSWEKDGHTNYRTEVIANQMTMLGSKQSSSSAGPQAAPPITESDDLPF